MSTVLPINTADLVCIGMRFAGESPQAACGRDVDIERTILDITEAFPEDTRLVSVFLSWIKVHGNYVIVEKLAKFASKRAETAWENNPWLSMAAAWAVECGYHKWKKLAKKMPAPVYLYPKAMSEGAITLKGAVPWLESLGFRIPQGSLRIREDDVAPPEKLVRHNLQYKNRYLFGASWRADIITAIQRGITSPAEISRVVGCSYEPAYRVSREYSTYTTACTSSAASMQFSSCMARVNS
jgi:hypothetical protein